MEDWSSKLFFLLLGGLLALLVNRFSERSKAGIEERSKLRVAYATWFALSRTMIRRSEYVARGTAGVYTNPESLKEFQTELMEIIAGGERVWQAAYEAYMLEPVSMIRESILLSVQVLDEMIKGMTLMHEHSQLQIRSRELIEIAKGLNTSLSDAGETVIDQEEHLEIQEIVGAADYNDLAKKLEQYSYHLDETIKTLRDEPISPWLVWYFNKKSRNRAKTPINSKTEENTSL